MRGRRPVTISSCGWVSRAEPPRRRCRPREWQPDSIAAEDFLPDIRDLAGAGRPGSLAALRARATRAAWTDDACRLTEGVLDPGDVEYVRYGSEALDGRFGNPGFAAALQ